MTPQQYDDALKQIREAQYLAVKAMKKVKHAEMLVKLHRPERQNKNEQGLEHRHSQSD